MAHGFWNKTQKCALLFLLNLSDSFNLCEVHTWLSTYFWKHGTDPRWESAVFGLFAIAMNASVGRLPGPNKFSK